MFNKRINAVRERLDADGFDGLLVYNFYNRFYLSGFSGSFGILLLTKERNILITDFRYKEQSQEEAADFEVVIHTASIYQTINELIEELSIKKLAFEGESVTFDKYLDLSKNINKAQLIPTKGIVEGIRAVKDDTEIQSIRKAVEIADSAFEHILPFITPGVREIDIALEIEFFMKKNGASKLSFDSIIASGPRSSLPHGKATERVVQRGDFVKMDFGGVYNGYCSDITRTVLVGEYSPKQREIYNIVLDAQIKAIEQIKAGMSGQKADSIAREVINNSGYGEYFGHGLGHSIGLEAHESPRLTPQYTGELKTNNVVTVEPGIYLPGWGGVRIEDMVVIKDDGCEVLSKSSKELIIL